MTNEEKANDLAKLEGSANNPVVSSLIEKKTLEMAKWKDEQVKQYLQHGKEFAQKKGNHDLAELFEIIIEDLKL